MNLLIKTLCCLGLLLPGTLSANAPAAASVLPAIVVSTGQVEEWGRNIGSELAFLRDPSGQLTIDDIVAPQTQARFAYHDALHFGHTRDAVWLRIPLQRRANVADMWRLEIAPSTLNELKFFAPDSAGAYTHVVHLGNRQPFADRPVAYRNFVLPLSLPDTRVKVFYVRLQSSPALTPVVRLWSDPSLRKAAQVELLLFGLIYGLLLAIVLGNIMIGIWIRSAIYFWFAAFTLLLVGMIFNLDGFLAQWVFPNHPAIPSRLWEISIALVTAGLLLIQRKPLRIAEHFPRIDRALPALALLTVALGLSSLFDAYHDAAPFIATVRTFAIILQVIAAWLEFRSGRPAARFFLFGCLLYAVLGSFATLHDYGYGLWPHMAVPAVMLAVTVLAGTLSSGVFREMLVEREARRTAEAALSQANALVDQERRLMATQTSFFSFVAHELRTPLSVIFSALSNLRNSVAEAGSEVQERIRRIDVAAHRLGDMIDRHLRLQRLAHGDFEPDLVEYSPDFSAIQACEAARESHPARLVELALLGDLPPLVTQDAELVTLALGNLLENATKYSPAGEPVRLEIAVDAAHPDCISYRVIDHGPGIGPEDQQRLFGIFSREAGNRQAGFGIGLALVANVARRHGGTVEYISQPGSGSTFILRLKMKPLVAKETV